MMTVRSDSQSDGSYTQFAMRSDSMNSMRSRPVVDAVSMYVVSSIQVYPFQVPPNFSMMPLICSRGILVVPLKFMCSTQCETPVSPVASSLDPTLYQHQTEASGAVCTSCTTTFNPLSRTVCRMVVHYNG